MIDFCCGVCTTDLMNDIPRHQSQSRHSKGNNFNTIIRENNKKDGDEVYPVVVVVVSSQKFGVESPAVLICCVLE